MPFFSVIIPTYNRSVLLKEAIDSVLNQNFKDFELFVIDDGSTDDTPEMIKECSDKLVYLKQKNSGVSSARNLGIKKCNGKYITFLDSDDSWLPGKLYEHLNFIKKNTEHYDIYLQGINTMLSPSYNKIQKWISDNIVF